MPPISPEDAAGGFEDLNFTDAELREFQRQSTEVNLNPLPQAEIDELLAGLDDSPDPDFQPDEKPGPVGVRWMEDLKVFRGRHGPFSTVEVVRIIQELNRSE